MVTCKGEMVFFGLLSLKSDYKPLRSCFKASDASSFLTCLKHPKGPYSLTALKDESSLFQDFLDQ